eukprot:4442814-Amphidinium_carterae.1
MISVTTVLPIRWAWCKALGAWLHFPIWQQHCSPQLVRHVGAGCLRQTRPAFPAAAHPWCA